MDYIFMSVSLHVQNPNGIFVPPPVAEQLVRPASVQTTTESEPIILTPTIDPARATFVAKQNLINEAANGISNTPEAGKAAETQADNSSEIAEQLKKMGIALAASTVDSKDRKFISLVTNVLDGIECNGSGVNIDDVPKAIGIIQDIFITAQKSNLDPSAAIRKQLQALNISSGQKTTMLDYFKQVLEQGNGAGALDAINLDALKKLALSKEGMLAVGTALYVFSNLLAQIPVIGNLLATPIKAVQALLGMAKDVVPMVLLMNRRQTAPEPAKTLKQASLKDLAA